MVKVIVLTIGIFSVSSCASILSKFGYPKELFDHKALAPAKVFDNFYMVGTQSVVVWAVQTSEGIILIDAMWNEKQGKMVEQHLRQLGVNPQEITYILITHGHGDHFGGSNHLRKISGAKVLIGENDFKLSQTRNKENIFSQKPIIDGLIKDGDKISLADTQILAVETPGHTAGSVSFIIPVKQNNQTHYLGMWGGTGLPKSRKELLDYQNSLQKFQQKCQEMNVKGIISGHLFFLENGYQRVTQAHEIQGRNAPNPLLQTPEEITAFFENLNQKVEKALEKYPK